MAIKKSLCFAATLFSMSFASAATLQVPIYKTIKQGVGRPIGTVTFQDTQYGLLIKPHLKDLKPGLHGFHIHEKPDCSNDGKQAGGHFDPQGTDQHKGPYNPNGHLGDLPVLYVQSDGQADVPVLAPRLSVHQIQGHSVMIHQQGDNYSDHPEALGGGGARVACGVIPK